MVEDNLEDLQRHYYMRPKQVYRGITHDVPWFWRWWYIFLTIFCSNILHTFVFYIIGVQTFDPYVSKAHVSVLCSFNLICGSTHHARNAGPLKCSLMSSCVRLNLLYTRCQIASCPVNARARLIPLRAIQSISLLQRGQSHHTKL